VEELALDRVWAGGGDREEGTASYRWQLEEITTEEDIQPAKERICTVRNNKP
jgi:hypothetical protein